MSFCVKPQFNIRRIYNFTRPVAPLSNPLIVSIGIVCGVESTSSMLSRLKLRGSSAITSCSHSQVTKCFTSVRIVFAYGLE
jgi:hypothetical protein